VADVKAHVPGAQHVILSLKMTCSSRCAELQSRHLQPVLRSVCDTEYAVLISRETSFAGTAEHKLTHPTTGTGVTGTHAHTSTVHTGGVGAEAAMAKHQVGQKTAAQVCSWSKLCSITGADIVTTLRLVHVAQHHQH
jgi:hypothetical protein